jgi:ribosomal protein S18 acetylase RimI-like enzyme
MVEIKEISIEDLAALQILGKQTFYETFAEHNTKEDINHYLDESFSSKKLQKELKDPNSTFYFALIDGENAGYLKINIGNAQTELKDINALEIERIYVLKKYLGQKVGQALFEKANSLAKEGGYKYIWLGVWEENKRALAFYTKNGFVAFDKHIFRLGNDEQIDILMKLIL